MLDPNQATQLQRPARILKFCLKHVKVFILSRERTNVLIRSHAAKSGFFASGPICGPNKWYTTFTNYILISISSYTLVEPCFKVVFEPVLDSTSEIDLCTKQSPISIWVSAHTNLRLPSQDFS